MIVSYKAGLAITLTLLLAACGGRVVPGAPGAGLAPVRQPTPATPVPAKPNAAAAPGATAATSGLVAGPPAAGLAIDRDRAAAALAAFRQSCASLIRRTDLSGLTRGDDWRPACTAAGTAAAAADPRGFFTRWFETVQVGDGKAFATGYYIPEIAASRDRRPGYDVPIYGRPSDLVEVDLGDFSEALKGKKIRGRIEGGALMPYFDRTEIEQGRLTNAPILAWAADPVALFFLQVQGSGVLRLADGGSITIGYATQNGRDYTGIGVVMRDRGLVKPGQLSMQGLSAWLHANPDQGVAIMRENRSYVFFRVLDGPPVGALGLPVTGGVTVAADVRFIPLGAPVFLSLDRADASGLWIAQDTGGAIKGANRVDTFWGGGREAEAIAGGMSGRGTAFLLLPVGTLARLRGVGSGGPSPRP
ncbi:murein transglycosylase A [uncultured Sphingomonas sp.]|uniref:murein transglycosylase A n=1 Tax=uncultured Sphingomonas sp. TaxID=158754 RepID=UPI0035C9A463